MQKLSGALQYVFFNFCGAGWQWVHATGAVDGPGESPLPHLHHRVRRLELRRPAVGDIHLRASAVVRTGQSRGRMLIMILLLFY